MSVGIMIMHLHKGPAIIHRWFVLSRVLGNVFSGKGQICLILHNVHMHLSSSLDLDHFISDREFLGPAVHVICLHGACCYKQHDMST